MNETSGIFSGLVEDYALGRQDYPTKVIDRVGRHFSPREGALILDLGCGVGKSTRQLAGPFRFVVGVDPDTNSIRKAQELGGHDLAYCRASAESLPFSDHRFDGITTFCAFHWYCHLPGALDEIYRVLKPNQYFVVVGHDDVGTFHQEVRGIVKRYSDKPIPQGKVGYNPAKLLWSDKSRWWVGTEQWEYTYKYRPDELLPQIRSMAPWSAVAKDRLEEASAAMEAHFTPQMRDGVFHRPVCIYLVVARKQ